MKPTLVVFVIAIVLCVVAFPSLGDAIADNPTTDPNTQQQIQAEQPDASAGRFQISAFTNSGGGTGFGYYVIDSTTGEFWMGYGSEKPSKVSDSLLK